MDRAVDVLETKRVFDGFLKLDEVTVRYQRPDGSMAGPVKRICMDRGDAVGVLVYVRSSDSFILVRQFRYPTLRHGEPFPIEIVAGAIDPGETPEEAALREVEEEIGVKVPKLTKLVEYYSSPGSVSEMLTLYMVELEAFEVPHSLGGLPEEDIEILSIGRQELFQMLERGEFRDGKTQVALLWWRASAKSRD